MTALLSLEPRSAQARIKEPAVHFEEGADEMHKRAGNRCCCETQSVGTGPVTGG